MNKECIYVNGKVIVSDEIGNQKVIDYFDSIDKLLLQENIIEMMDNTIKEINEQLSKYNDNKFKPYNTYILSGLTVLFLNIITHINKYPTFIKTQYGNFNKALLYEISCLLFILPCIISCFKSEYDKFVEIKNILNGLKIELRFLLDQYPAECEELQNIFDNQTLNNIPKNYESIKIDNDVLDNLKSLEDLHFDIGYNFNNYYNYYINNTLSKNLSSKYTEDGIDIIKDFFEENDVIITKKKKK